MNNSKINTAGRVFACIVGIPLAVFIAVVTIAALMGYGVYLVELATR